jgi:hypothetical protein
MNLAIGISKVLNAPGTDKMKKMNGFFVEMASSL